MQLLLLCFLATTAAALKSPTLCPNGTGNEFVCNVIKPVNSDESYTKAPTLESSITIGKNGQADFFKSAKALEILRGSLRDQTYAEALKTTNYKWFQTLGKVEAQLNQAGSGTQKQVSSVAAGLKSLQESVDKTTTANAKKVEQAVSDANNKLSEQINKKEIEYLNQGYNEVVAKCQETISKQIEVMQDRSSKTVERAYNSLIDLTDQVGLCIQNGEIEGRCASNVQTKLNAVRTLGRSSESEAKKFEDAGKKSFDKDPCFSRALKSLEDGVNRVVKNSPQVSKSSS